MKIGDLLTVRDENEWVAGEKLPLLIVLGIEKHAGNAQRDRILLQWMPNGYGDPIKGVFSRMMVEKKYRVV